MPPHADSPAVQPHRARPDAFWHPVQIHWYGITYLVAFGLFLWLARLRVRKPWFADAGWTARDVEDLLFFGVLGVVLGGRLGYVLFYKPAFYLANPLEIFSVWKGACPSTVGCWA
jgi:phosphatidylglycerol:prolipoprotein diacylglycerol transferase